MSTTDELAHDAPASVRGAMADEQLPKGDATELNEAMTEAWREARELLRDCEKEERTLAESMSEARRKSRTKASLCCCC